MTSSGIENNGRVCRTSRQHCMVCNLSRVGGVGGLPSDSSV